MHWLLGNAPLSCSPLIDRLDRFILSRGIFVGHPLQHERTVAEARASWRASQVSSIQLGAIIPVLLRLVKVDQPAHTGHLLQRLAWMPIKGFG